MMCPETRSVGAYLLGALDPQEQVEMERHLITCEICRQEVIEVAHLPGLMHRLTLDDVTQRASGRHFQAEPRPGLGPESDLARPSAEVTTADTSFRSVWMRRISQSRVLLLTMIIVVVLAIGGVIELTV